MYRNFSDEGLFTINTTYVYALRTVDIDLDGNMDNIVASRAWDGMFVYKQDNNGALSAT